MWDFAKAENFVIVSTDSDFYELATTAGPPPKVVWLRRWKHPTRTRSRYCGATPSGLRNLRPIPNSRCSFLTATKVPGTHQCEVTRPCRS